MRQTIFISHATPEDNNFTIWLASRLQSLGYDVWIDKNGLLGGEKFWEEIDDVIRNKAIKVLLVYSNHICQKDENGNTLAGRLKDGIYKEFSLAESVGKQTKIKDFTILLNIDGATYNLFIGADRLNQIPFYENWADGLKQLEKKLIKEQVPKLCQSSNERFINWFQFEYVIPNPIVTKKELYYTNIWSIDNLPKELFIHQFKTEEQAKDFVETHKKFPLSKISNNVSSFEGDLLYDESTTIFPEHIFCLSIRDILLGFNSEKFPTYDDGSNHLKYLLKKVFHQLMKNRGMFWYEMSNKRLAYFYTPANLNTLKVKFSYPFRKASKNKTKNLVGTYKTKSKWHYAVSVKPILTPIIGFSLKSHITFTDDGFKVWENSDQIHSARRNKGKLFFNEEWRDMFLAFLHGLKNFDGEIKIALANDFTLNLTPFPVMFWSEFGYFDPKDKTRQGLLSVYEDDEEDIEEEEAHYE
jgi:hypothetical protein